MIVIGIDPSLCNTGLAVMDLQPNSERVIATSVVRTEPSPKKLHVLVSDDNARRISDITGRLYAAIEKHLPVALVVEAPPGQAKSCQALRGLALSHGAVIAVARIVGLPLVHVQPLDVKRAVCGHKAATKEDIILALERRFPDVPWPEPASVVEHAADAIGAVLAASDSDVLRLARTMGGRAA